MGYLSLRGKPLLSKHVWSMIKKNRVRLERSKEFQKEIRNFRWVYNDDINDRWSFICVKTGLDWTVKIRLKSDYENSIHHTSGSIVSRVIPKLE